MLWPEGSTGVLADLGSYLNPPLDAPLETFAVSKAGAFLAAASKTVLALFRLKPLAPLYINPALFPGTEIKELVASTNGEFVAVRTADNRVSVFSVQPHENIEEALRLTTIITPGPGEAIGARELWIRPLHSMAPEYAVTALGQFAGTLVLYSAGAVHLAEWKSFMNPDPLHPPALRPVELGGDFGARGGVSGCFGREQFVIAAHSETQRAVKLSVFDASAGTSASASASASANASADESSSTRARSIELPIAGTPCCMDYNVRLHKLAVGTREGRVFVFPRLDDEPQSFEISALSAATPQTLQWNAAGTVLFVGYADGWQLLSMLGLSLYSTRDPSGIRSCEFLISGEAAVMLGSDGRLKFQNMLRWSGFGGIDQRPVLHGNGRLLLYHDVKVQTTSGGSGHGSGARNGGGNDSGNGGNGGGGSSSSTNGSGASTVHNSGVHSWLTVPLPTWYMAQNWPIAHVCSSHDGRYVAVAGKLGMMLFSVLTKQWKEIGDRDSMVRGGLCWHGRRLVAASLNPDNGFTSLKMYSPVDGQNHPSTHSQAGSQFLWGSSSSSSSSSPPAAASKAAHRSRGSVSGIGGGSSTNLLSSGRRMSAQDLLAADTNTSTPVTPASALLGSALPSSTSISNLNVSRDEQQVVAEDILGRGTGCLVSLMAMGPHELLGVVAGEHQKHLLVYDLGANDFELVRDVPLTTILQSHDEFNPDPVIRAISIVDQRQVFVLVKNTLILVSSVGDDERQYELRVIADPIESFEYLHFDKQLWVFDGQEGVVTEFRVSGSNTEKRFVASVPLDAYPVHFSSNRGVASLIESEPVRSFDGKFCVARPSFSQEVYIQFLLEAAIVPAYATAVEIAAKYQKMPYFAGILESLLYRAVVNDDDRDGVETQLAVNLVREFPAQNALAVYAMCARKVEMKYWPKLFKAVGAEPAELFDKSLASADLETATEYLIVVQTDDKAGTDDKLDLRGRILALYNAASKFDQSWICRQVCEFIMAVDPTGDSLREFRTYIE